MQKQELKEIFLWGDINDKFALDVIDKLYFISESTNKVDIMINSDGGSIESTVSIIDTMSMLQNRGMIINTIVCGRACSAAVNILIQGNKKYATKNSFLMVHKSWYDLTSDYDHIQKSTVEFWTKYTEIFLDNIVKSVKPKFKKIIKDGMVSGLWLTSNEALNMGLIDNIWN